MQMREIRLGIEKKLKVSYYTNSLFSHWQMKEIRLQNERTYKRYCKAERKEAYKDVYVDEGEYLYKFRRKDRLYPMATLVVYWGERGWTGPRNLHE